MIILSHNSMSVAVPAVIAGLTRNPVRIRSSPAAVFGDEGRKMPLEPGSGKVCLRMNHKSEDLP